MISSSGDGHDDENPFGKDSNVVPLRVPRNKSETSEKNPATKKSSEAIINLPPVTKYFLAFIIAVHLIVTFVLSDAQAHSLFINLGFIPGRFNGNAIFQSLALITPLTHIFLHGSWLHLGMNAIMLMAFGSGIEKWIGGKKMILVFLISSLFGIIAHFILNYNSIMPVIGASGGLSGLFAVAIVMLNRQHGGMTGRYGMWPLILIWVGVSILFGFMGSPDGNEIAWAAHVGGFLGGFVAIKLLRI